MIPVSFELLLLGICIENGGIMIDAMTDYIFLSPKHLAYYYMVESITARYLLEDARSFDLLHCLFSLWSRSLWINYVLLTLPNHLPQDARIYRLPLAFFVVSADLLFLEIKVGISIVLLDHEYCSLFLMKDSFHRRKRCCISYHVPCWSTDDIHVLFNMHVVW